MATWARGKRRSCRSPSWPTSTAEAFTASVSIRSCSPVQRALGRPSAPACRAAAQRPEVTNRPPKGQLGDVNEISKAEPGAVAPGRRGGEVRGLGGQGDVAL